MTVFIKNLSDLKWFCLLFYFIFSLLLRLDIHVNLDESISFTIDAFLWKRNWIRILFWANKFIREVRKYKQKLKYEIISSLNKLRTEINGDKIDEEITFIKKYVISEEGFNCFNKKVFICETNNIINSVKNIISSLRDLEGKKSKLDGRLPVDVSNIYNTALNIKKNLLSGGTILTQEQTSIINNNYSNIEKL